MYEPQQLEEICGAIRRQTAADSSLLGELRDDVRTALRHSKVIRPHSATAVAFVASEGANNRLVFDPFSMQLVRIVNSQGRQLFLDVISPRSDPEELVERHRQAGDALHVLMEDLQVTHLNELSPMIPTSEKIRHEPDRVSPSWTRDYRDLAEWAELYHQIKYSNWVADTLIVRHGLLRSKTFGKTGFVRMGELILDAIADQRRKGIRIFLVGLAKHSDVLARYRLAMALESTFPATTARYVNVPRRLEEKVYKWKEYARGPEDENESAGEQAKFVIGSMFLVRFGPETHDPIWAIDLLESQASEAEEIFGYLLQDAIDGFPIPFYPRCLQRAQEHAHAVDFDLDVLQDTVSDAVRALVEESKRPVFDGLTLAPNIANPRHD
jgi:hypothetical protein